MADQTTLIPVPLDAGIDLSASENGPPRGVAGMLNWTFRADGDVGPRGTFARRAETATYDVVPGQLLPADGDAIPVRNFTSAYSPLETSVVGHASSGARVLNAQSDICDSYTLLALTCREETVDTDASTTAADAHVAFTVYDADQKVVTLFKSSGWGSIADVKVTAAAVTGATLYWLITYIDPINLVLRRRVVSLVKSTGIVTVGAAVNLLTSVDIFWKASGHAVELESTATNWIVFGWSGGHLYRVTVSSSSGSGTVLATVDTTYTNTTYHEMSSAKVDSKIYLVSGHSSASSLGIYIFNATTLAVTRDSYAIGALPTRRTAIIPQASVDNAYILFELPSPKVGINILAYSALAGVTATYGELQNVMLADAGTWVTENSSPFIGTKRVGLIGLSSWEAVSSNFRSHLVVRVTDSIGTPSIQAAALVAHSDAGVYTTIGSVTAGTNVGKAGVLPRWSRISSTEVEAPLLHVTRSTADLAVPGDTWDRACRRTRVIAQARGHHGRVTLGPNTYIGGSVPCSWDGVQLTPAGFPLPPHTVLAEDNGNTTPHITEGTYTYKVRSQYQDAKGTIFESPVMVATSTSTVTTPTGHTPKFTIYPSAVWLLTQTGDTPRFRTEVFRTPDTAENGSTVYNKAYAVTHDVLASAITKVDQKSAASIASNELLPDATTGALTSGPLPALAHLWAHRSRLFGIDAYDPELVRFTTEYVAPTAPLWADELSLRVTNSGGPCVAGASLGDKLVVFQSDQICIASGEGPDALGGGTFSYPEALRGVGALPGSQGAVVETPTGVMFVHSTGIYHLGFDMQLTFVGQKLSDRFQSPTFLAGIKRAVFIPSRREVWFLTSGAPDADLGTIHILVWDTVKNRWTTYHSQLGPFSDAIEVAAGVFLQDNHGRLVEAVSSSNLYDLDEAGTPVDMSLELTLPHVAADNTRQMRLRKIHLSGKHVNVDAILDVQVTAHNDSRGHLNEETVLTYSFPFSALPERWQSSLRAATQRCTQAQCKLTVTSVAPGASDLLLSTLDYEITVFGGTGKVPKAKRPTIA